MYQKLYDITKMIYELYEQLLEKEKKGDNNSKSYLKIVESINLCKYMEDRYYKELTNYDIDSINDLAKSFNIDNCVSPDASNFEFALELYDKESIIKRRIFLRLVDIMISMEDDDYFFNFVNEEIFELDHGTFALNGKNVAVGNRARRICEMLWNIHDNLFLSYISEIQKKIDKNNYKEKYLRYKYIAIFITPKIENKVLENNFNITDELNISYPFQNTLDVSIYNELMDLNIVTELSQMLEDIQYIENPFMLSAAKTYIESISYPLDPSLKEEFIYELSSNYVTKKYAKLIK